MKLWQKKYNLNKKIEKYTVGNDHLIDLNLVEYDCIASIAHAKMLNKIGIVNKKEFIKIKSQLNNIIKLKKKNKFKIKIEEEDCHTAIENYLGKLGKKIHTARSRNDQVLTAIRLYSKDKLKKTEVILLSLIKTLDKLNVKHKNIDIPGYTHQRKAMPYTAGKFFEAFKESLEDNITLLKTAYKLNDQNPLGSAAGYGVDLKINKEFTTNLLGFKKIQNNDLYCQNSRGKIESVIIFALSQIMLDLGKLANDLILFSMDEFGYFMLPKEFCTGSSIMPHKHNPDVLELVRAKSAVVSSYLFQVNEIIKNLHSGYNRDFQLIKEPLIKSFNITIDSMKIMDLVLANLKVNKEKCRKACTKDVYSVNKAYDLVKKGMPFRDAYKKISKNLGGK